MTPTHLQGGNGKDKADGSCMIVVATDAPLDARNLKRLAASAWMGVARTGSSASNCSGDSAIAFSTAPEGQIAFRSLHRRIGAFSQRVRTKPLVTVTDKWCLCGASVKAQYQSGTRLLLSPVIRTALWPRNPLCRLGHR